MVGGVLSSANPATTLFNVISKSGSTAETMAQFLLFTESLRSHLGAKWREHVVVTTDAKAGALRPFAEANDLPCFTIPDNVGGRFSVLTPVGLLPGALMGWDLDGLLAGARIGREHGLRTDLASNPSALLAVAQHALDTQSRCPIQVLFAYSHRLRRLADWNVQLVAESLGKRTPEGRGVGPTPHAAIGTTDQHSQVQLFAQGPSDKVFTFLRVERHPEDVDIPKAPPGVSGLDYMDGKSFGQLLDAECRATYLALVEAGRPCCMQTFPEVTAAQRRRVAHGPDDRDGLRRPALRHRRLQPAGRRGGQGGDVRADGAQRLREGGRAHPRDEAQRSALRRGLSRPQRLGHRRDDALQRAGDRESDEQCKAGPAQPGLDRAQALAVFVVRLDATRSQTGLARRDAGSGGACSRIRVRRVREHAAHHLRAAGHQRPGRRGGTATLASGYSGDAHTSRAPQPSHRLFLV